MKKLLIIFVCFFSLSMCLAISGCSSSGSKTQNPASQPSTQSTSTNKTFTLDELKKYDGQNGNPAYVAVNGTIYDVTNAKDWNKGKHKGGITAGKDLTNEIQQSPHGTDVLKDLPIVGTLKK